MPWLIVALFALLGHIEVAMIMTFAFLLMETM
ncbi:hypothetical protein UFOVP181_16 [uncultured Caudovirales phage]|uniref:Uncharacterized protein n=1 Tax=uncultured Caudovirales phage TaxID=2100421 RepID=A0A6J5KST4_9CAUD|nr:hypothetical protein UFOVP57_147 [uncultured Caudovirales phage]CAB5208416.1 hypothetical protein UFOVP181_16 [uncultured Caudovirales phage]